MPERIESICSEFPSLDTMARVKLESSEKDALMWIGSNENRTHAMTSDRQYCFDLLPGDQITVLSGEGGTWRTNGMDLPTPSIAKATFCCDIDGMDLSLDRVAGMTP